MTPSIRVYRQRARDSTLVVALAPSPQPGNEGLTPPRDQRFREERVATKHARRVAADAPGQIRFVHQGMDGACEAKLPCCVVRSGHQHAAKADAAVVGM